MAIRTEELLKLLGMHHLENEGEVLGKIGNYIERVGNMPTLPNAKRCWKAILKTAHTYGNPYPYDEETIAAIRDFADSLFYYGHRMELLQAPHQLWEADMQGTEAYWYIVDPEVLIEEVDNVPAPKNSIPLTPNMPPLEAKRLHTALNSDGFACLVTLENWTLAFSGIPLDELEGHPLADVTASTDDSRVVLSQIHFYYLMVNLIKAGAIGYNNSNMKKTFTALTGWTKSPTSAASSFAKEKELSEYNRKAKTFLDDIIRSFTKL